MICRGRHGAVRLRRRATWLDDDSTRDTGRRLREFGRLQEVSFEGTQWVPFFIPFDVSKRYGLKENSVADISRAPNSARGSAPGLQNLETRQDNRRGPVPKGDFAHEAELGQTVEWKMTGGSPRTVCTPPFQNLPGHRADPQTAPAPRGLNIYRP